MNKADVMLLSRFERSTELIGQDMEELLLEREAMTSLSKLVKPPSPFVVTHQSFPGDTSVRKRVKTNNKPNTRSLDTRSFASIHPIDTNAPVEDYYG
jgi:hypothetical protein